MFSCEFAKLLRTHFYIEYLLLLLLQLAKTPVGVLPYSCSETFHKIHKEIDAIESVSQNYFFIVKRQGNCLWMKIQQQLLTHIHYIAPVYLLKTLHKAQTTQIYLYCWI